LEEGIYLFEKRQRYHGIKIKMINPVHVPKRRNHIHKDTASRGTMIIQEKRILNLSNTLESLKFFKKFLLITIHDEADKIRIPRMTDVILGLK